MSLLAINQILLMVYIWVVGVTEFYSETSNSNTVEPLLNATLVLTPDDKPIITVHISTIYTELNPWGETPPLLRQ